MWWSALLGPIMGIFDKTLDRVIPDKNARAKAKEVLASQKADFEHDISTALMSISRDQLKINLAEAKHKSVFVAGWRPFIGWVCGVGIAWTFVLQPFLGCILVACGKEIQLPVLNMGVLTQLVMTMLGFGGMRSWEKSRGIAREESPFKGKKNGD